MSAPAIAFEPRRSLIAPSLRLTRQVGWISCWIGLGACAIGLTTQSPVGLSLGTAVSLGGIALISISRLRSGGVSPITLFALSSAVAALCNALGMSTVDTPRRYQYFIYANDTHLMFAAELMFLGGILPVLGFLAVSEWKGFRPVLSGLPRVYGRLTPPQLMIWGTVLATVSIVLRITNRMPSLGTITDFYVLMPVLVAFCLARVAGARDDMPALRLALFIAAVEGIRALLYSYLRSDMILPLFAVVSGLLLGARTTRVLSRPVLYPLYAATIAFVLYFGALGSVRGDAAGTDRFAALAIEQERDASLGDAPMGDLRARNYGFLARLTNFNQLTRVRQLVDEQGFMNGGTLEYLAYVFIPRAIWAEKPKIEKGAWFAFAIGQAYQAPDGRFNNSINMTVQGELYLNYGWVGVFLGCTLFGSLLGIFWVRTEFWGDINNTLGSAFGFYQFWIGAFLGADLQLTVSMLALYIFCSAVGLGLTLLQRRR